MVSAEFNRNETLKVDRSSFIDYVMVNSEQRNPALAHFFNGSYSAYDIMQQLVKNKSLIHSQNYRYVALMSLYI